MRRQMLIARFASMVWALEPTRYAVCAAVLKRWASGVGASEEVMAQVRADTEARDARRATVAGASSGGIAVLPLYGVITQRGNSMDDISGPGSVSTQMFTQTLRETVADDSVGAIILDIDSPGGSVYGVQELADEIYAAREQKPVISYANSLAASAAYWLGSQATEFHVTPSGEVGSIGVISAHEDWSKFNEEAGITVTYITAGEFKAEGNPDQPLSAEALAFQQGRVDDYYAAFTKGVARGRGVGIGAVRSDMGKGRCFGADQAMAAKMVDAVSTFDEVVGRARKLMGPAKASKRSAAAVQAQIENRIRISSQG